MSHPHNHHRWQSVKASRGYDAEAKLRRQRAGKLQLQLLQMYAVLGLVLELAGSILAVMAFPLPGTSDLDTTQLAVGSVMLAGGVVLFYSALALEQIRRR